MDEQFTCGYVMLEIPIRYQEEVSMNAEMMGMSIYMEFNAVRLKGLSRN